MRVLELPLIITSLDLNEPGESIEHRSGLSEFYTDGPHTEKARDVKLRANCWFDDEHG